MELSILSTSYGFFQNVHIKADEREYEYKAVGVMWFNTVKVSHSLSCLHYLVPFLKPWTNCDHSVCVHLIGHPDTQSEQYVKSLYCQSAFS